MASDSILGGLATQLTAAAQLEALNLIYAREATLATAAKQDTAQASLDTIAARTPALESGRVPVALPAATVTALTPPAAITGYATESTLSTLNTKTPSLGQAVAGSSIPVVLPAAQVSALTPPAAISGFALETTQAAANTKLDTLHSDLDGVELLLSDIRDNTAGGGGGGGGDASAVNQLTQISDWAAGVRGVRRDADDTPASDGTAHPLYTNQYGRLKVSAMPGAMVATTGDITAIQATIGTPVAGGTVQADVSRASNVMMYCTGSFTLVNCTFEGSIDGGANWFAIQAVRSNANTVELTTGSMSAPPAYGWELSVNAMTHVRVRATARTSGTQSWRILPGAYATEPVPAVQTHPVTQSGTWNVSAVTTVAAVNSSTPANGTPFALTTAATTNLTAVKGGAGNLYNVAATNTSGATIYLKLYNKTTAPVPASDVSVLVIPVAANSVMSLDFGPVGQRFSTGIAYSVTGAQADTDTTAIAAGCKIFGCYI